MGKLLLITAILLFTISESVAQNSDSLFKVGKELLNNGSIYFDKTTLVEAEQKFQEALDSDSTIYIFQYFLAYTDYRLAIYYHITKDDDQFNNYIVLAESELQAILDSSENNSEVLSLLASSYGEQIVANSDSTKILDPRALLIMSKAIDVDHENPRVQLLAGKLSLTLPEKFGGNKEKSLIHLKRSVELFESNQDSYDDIDWGYIYSLAWLGKNYVELNDYSTAINIYNKALEIEPDFVWIKNILLPEASDKLDENNK